MNYTEYTLGSKNNINDYSYYTNNTNETVSTINKNCTQNCNDQANETEEAMIEEINENVTPATENTDVYDSKTKTITLLDFSNYLIPSEEISDSID